MRRGFWAEEAEGRERVANTWQFLEQKEAQSSWGEPSLSSNSLPFSGTPTSQKESFSPLRPYEHMSASNSTQTSYGILKFITSFAVCLM